MPPREDALDRPEFESIALDVDADEAGRYVDDAVKGLSTSKTDEGVKYRTTNGMLVAILGPGRAGSGGETTRLAYRTEPASESATRKAGKIRDALDPHAIEQ